MINISKSTIIAIIVLNLAILGIAIFWFIAAPTKSIKSCSDEKAAEITVREEAIKICNGQWDGRLIWADPKGVPAASCVDNRYR